MNGFTFKAVLVSFAFLTIASLSEFSIAGNRTEAGCMTCHQGGSTETAAEVRKSSDTHHRKLKTHNVQDE